MDLLRYLIAPFEQRHSQLNFDAPSVQRENTSNDTDCSTQRHAKTILAHPSPYDHVNRAVTAVSSQHIPSTSLLQAVTVNPAVTNVLMRQGLIKAGETDTSSGAIDGMEDRVINNITPKQEKACDAIDSRYKMIPTGPRNRPPPLAPASHNTPQTWQIRELCFHW